MIHQHAIRSGPVVLFALLELSRLPQIHSGSVSPLEFVVRDIRLSVVLCALSKLARWAVVFVLD